MKMRFSFEEKKYLSSDQMQAFFELINGFEYIDRLSDDGVAFVKAAVNTLERRIDILNDHAERLDRDNEIAIVLLDSLIADISNGGTACLKERLERIRKVLIEGVKDEN